MTRSEEYAQRFEQEQQRLIDLITPLDEARWKAIGASYPQRLNDEDEGRPIGVIAHHVVTSAEGILERILAAAQGRAQRPAGDYQAENARHAAEHRDVTKAEVLDALRRQKDHVASALRGLTDADLDRTTDTGVGPMSVSQRIERVLIGHVSMHAGSIEAALRAEG